MTAPRTPSPAVALAASALLTLVASAAPAGGDPPKPGAAGDMPLAFHDDFDAGSASWEFTDADAWRVAPAEGGQILELHKQSKYAPAVRSPLNIALVKGVDVDAFVLDVRVRSTGRDYGHRDLCLVFGHQDPSHFYYVHLAKEADAAANSVFLVDGKPRTSVAEERTKGTAWTDGWHHVRVVRKPADGLVAVYFDDMARPVMTAHDKTLTHGRVGLGSFDDTGQFDALRVWGVTHRAKP